MSPEFFLFLNIYLHLNMKKFYSENHIPTVSLLWIIATILIATPFLTPTKIFAVLILIVVVAALLIWILIDTKYKIDHSFLYYNSGPIRGKIDIFRINTIEHQKNWIVNSALKPALGTKGLIIKYNKFDDIYISPKNKDAFIAALLEVNSDIEIK